MGDYHALTTCFRCVKEPLGIASLVLLGLQKDSGSAAFLGTACTFAGINAVQLVLWLFWAHDDTLAWDAWYSLQGYSFLASMVQLGLHGREDAAFVFFFCTAFALAGLQILAIGAVLLLATAAASDRSEDAVRHLYVALFVVPFYFFVAAFVRLGTCREGTDAMFIGFLSASLVMFAVLIGCCCCFFASAASSSSSSWPEKVDELECQFEKCDSGSLLLARFSTGGFLATQQ